MTEEAWQQEDRAESGEISSSTIDVEHSELEVGGGYKSSKPTFTNTLLSAGLCLLNGDNLPKQHYQLGRKCSDTTDYQGYFNSNHQRRPSKDHDGQDW